MLVPSNTDSFILAELVAAERDDRAAKDLQGHGPGGGLGTGAEWSVEGLD